MTDDTSRKDGLNNDPQTDRRDSEAPEGVNTSQRHEDSQAQSVADDALAAHKAEEAAEEIRQKRK